MLKTFLIIAYPFLELFVLVEAGDYIGGFGVVCAVIAGIIFGGWIMQLHGRSALARVRGELHSGRVPHETMLESMLVFLAGLLFIIPGFISDAVGLLLLIPPIRRLCAAKLLTYFAQKQRDGESGFQGTFIFRGGSFSSQGSAGSFGHGHSGDSAETTVIDCTVEPASPEGKDCAYSPREGLPGGQSADTRNASPNSPADGEHSPSSSGNGTPPPSSSSKDNDKKSGGSSGGGTVYDV